MQVASIRLGRVPQTFDDNLDLSPGKGLGDLKGERLPSGLPLARVGSLDVFPELFESLFTAFRLLGVRAEIELVLRILARLLVELPAQIAAVLAASFWPPSLPLPCGHGNVSEGPR